MGLRDWLVKFLYEEVEVPDSASEVSRVESQQVQVDKPEEDTSKLIKIGEKTQNISEMQKDLETLDNDHYSLQLDKIKSETQIINNIIDDLQQDFSSLRENSDRREELSSVISARIKNLTLRGLALKVMLNILEVNYYNVLISKLKELSQNNKADGLSNKADGLSFVMQSVENYLIVLRDMQEKLGNLVVYDYKMNYERNKDFANAIFEGVEEFNLFLGDIKNKLVLNILDSQDNNFSTALKQARQAVFATN